MKKLLTNPLPLFVAFFALLAVGAFLPAHSPAAAPGSLDAGDVAWMLTAAGLVLLMTPGLAYFYGGMVTPRNVISTMFQSVIAMSVVSLLWVVVGFSLSFGTSIGGVIGDPRTFLYFNNVGAAPDPALAPTIPLVLFALFQLKFAIITPALVTGAFAERVKFASYLLFMCLFTLLIYCPLAHMTWHPDGLLRKAGVLDFAGGTVVHMSAGFAALAGALVLGRRRSHLAGAVESPANIPFVILGTGMLWFGWFGFNGGSALAANSSAALAVLTTNSASASAMLAWLMLDRLRGHKLSALNACIGAVVGLVAITPGAGYVSVGASLLIGAIAACVSNLLLFSRTRLPIDDTLDVFPCHGLGGLVGMILTGVFAADKGLVAGETAVFRAHMIALPLVVLFVFGGSYLIFKVVNRIVPLRVPEDDEVLGLDLSQHDERFGFDLEAHPHAVKVGAEG